MPEIILKNITKRFGKSVAVDNLNLVIKDGDFVSLLGPSGCGKTTTLRMIAGLETPTEGEIYIDGKLVFSSEKGVDVSPDKRNVGFLFQNYALWPHMTVYKNIAFGLENMKWDKEKIRKRVEELLDTLKIREYVDRYPAELSGGQQQRVAIARTLATNPKILLMDEPLSNLDAKLRMEMRTELKRLHQETGSTFVYVTHDQTEAMSMATDIVLMNQGEIKQVDSPEKIYNDPDNLFAAQFIGNPTMNLFKREEMDPLLRLPVDIETIGFRPSKVRLLETGDTVSEGELVTSGPILTRELMGSEIIYRIQAPFGVITFKTFNEKQLPEDQTVRAAVMKKSMFFFDKAGRRVRV